MKIMKTKGIALIVGLTFVFSSEATIASKGASINGQKSVKSNLNLTVESEVDIYGVQFDIKYNPAELTLTEDAIVSKVAGVNFYSRVKDDGFARVLMFGMNGEKILDVNQTRIGDLIDVNFTPANKFSGSSLVELKDVTLAGQAGEEVSVSTASYEVSFVTPQKTSLSENYPNPFNPSTTIDYQIAEPGKVSIIVYDLKGAEVNILVNQYQDAAYHSVVWNGLNDNGLAVASGRYILKMNAPGYSETITMTLLK
jgi:hypothetical protein